MASLNTLRTKGGWFLTAVIVIALLMFVLGDVWTSGGNQNPVVGEINGVKVKYQDYMHEYRNQEGLIKMMGGQDQGDQASDNAWTELIMQHSFLPGFELLGLDNSEQEQIDMTSGAYISPVIMGYFSNPQTGRFDLNLMRDFISNMSLEQRMQWNYIQKRMNEKSVN